MRRLKEAEEQVETWRGRTYKVSLESLGQWDPADCRWKPSSERVTSNGTNRLNGSRELMKGNNN